MSAPDVLFVSYADTLHLLSTADAMRFARRCTACRHAAAWCGRRLRVCGSTWGRRFTITGTVKGVLLKETPITGVRLYNYFDDGSRNTVGSLERLGYVLLSDPATGQPLALVDEHWSYAHSWRRRRQ